MKLSVAKRAVSDEPEEGDEQTREIIQRIKASIILRLEKYRMFPPPQNTR